MSNLIKMELYKLRTSKLFTILLICCAVLNIVCSVGGQMIVKAVADDAGAVTTDFSSVLTAPFTFDMLMMFTFISVVSFLYLDFNNGYIKNIAGQVPNRGYVVISKFAVVAIHNLIYFLVASISNLIAGCITGMNFDTQNIGSGIATFAIKWLLSLSMCAVLMFFTIGLKSKSFALILAVMFPLGAFSLIYMGIDTAIKNLLKIKSFSLGNYMPDTLLGTVDVAEGTMVANGIIIAIIFLALFYTLTHITFNKRDIK